MYKSLIVWEYYRQILLKRKKSFLKERIMMKLQTNTAMTDFIDKDKFELESYLEYLFNLASEK